MANGYTEQLGKQEALSKLTLDKRFYDTVFGEAGGGSPEEVTATASVYLNLISELGYEKALKRSAAYNKKSKQYRKASTGKMNAFEKAVYVRNQKIIDTLVANPSLVAPFTYHENVNVFGEPSWAKDMESFEDIGRQRFYVEGK